MTNRTNSFRHLIDAIKRTPVKSQHYINDYCANEHVLGVVFTAKEKHLSVLWLTSEAQHNYTKTIATVIDKIQYIVCADSNDLAAMAASQEFLAMYNKENPSNVIRCSEPVVDNTDDDDDDDDDDIEDYDGNHDDTADAATAQIRMSFGIPTRNRVDDAECGINDLAEAVRKLAKKVKKINKKVNA